jgi:hypothetical protein
VKTSCSNPHSLEGPPGKGRLVVIELLTDKNFLFARPPVLNAARAKPLAQRGWWSPRLQTLLRPNAPVCRTLPSLGLFGLLWLVLALSRRSSHLPFFAPSACPSRGLPQPESAITTRPNPPLPRQDLPLRACQRFKLTARVALRMHRVSFEITLPRPWRQGFVKRHTCLDSDAQAASATAQVWTSRRNAPTEWVWKRQLDAPVLHKSLRRASLLALFRLQSSRMYAIRSS